MIASWGHEVLGTAVLNTTFLFYFYVIHFLFYLSHIQEQLIEFLCVCVCFFIYYFITEV